MYNDIYHVAFRRCVQQRMENGNLCGCTMRKAHNNYTHRERKIYIVQFGRKCSYSSMYLVCNVHGQYGAELNCMLRNVDHCRAILSSICTHKLKNSDQAISIHYLAMP